ncbi:Site-specific DNA recombinase [Selenomonas ruminantium]|uniref:Site-specific DNA recombinase n=2 Tax=Selenomonas ruminantium TaxID=971 RepID=A0A1I0V5S5_SELRU|nr:Site-specific DNA recombinase [Selenomonas ruminantium]
MIYSIKRKWGETMRRITRIDAVNDSSKKKLRVAAYARVSTGSQDQLVSLETQKIHYERYIKARPDWEYAGLYYDEGISGLKMSKRKGLLRLIEDCSKGLIDYIVVKSISRFSRNTVESIEVVRKLCQDGVYIYFEKENIDTGKMEGELLLSILSGLAENESRSISGNVKWSIQKRYLNGTFKICYPPYGYDNVDGKMVVNKEQAKIVRRIFAEIIAGKSSADIAKELNKEGIITKRGKRWGRGVVCEMIRNEKYTGDVIFQKTYTDSCFKRHRNYDDKNKYQMKNHHEAIISYEDFKLANLIVDANGCQKGIHKNDFKYKNRYPTSGKIICGECGGHWNRRKIGNMFGFACNTHINDMNACSMKSIKEDSVKAAFVTMMNKLTFARKSVLIPYSEMLRRSKEDSDVERLDEIETLLQKSSERRQQLMEFFSQGILDHEVYAYETVALSKEECRLMAEKNFLSVRMNGSQEWQSALVKLLRYTAKGNVLTEFEGGLFTEHVEKVVVYKRTEIGFVMKCGPIFRERI